MDDSLTVRMDLAEAFESAGFEAILSSSLREARDALGARSIDLLILDVLLPDGDGVELIKDIRADKARQSLPVLILSSEAEVKDRLRGLKTGADDYVGKPYDAAYVVARGRELLSRHESATMAPTIDDEVTVLVIDDSVTFREELERVLDGAGYAVVSAASGEEGLRLAGSRRPAALIVDGAMPGMDGSTVIRKLRLDAVLRGVPCLLLTASDERGVELEALEAGADAFVRKDEEMEVILIRLAAMLRSADTVRDPRSSPARPKRVLAVDDSMTYLNELGSILRDEGYDVILARSGEEAIDLLGAQNVDCILMDLMMPGIGGQEACRRIKGSPTLRSTPLIMLTALEDRQALIEGLSTGADDYVHKSSEFDVLRARIQAQLRRKQFEDENRRIRDQLLRSELEAAEARAAQHLAETKAALAEELEYKNRELEAFSYSVSHDLRAPLRGIDGFSQALIEDYADRLDDTGRGYLDRIRGAAQRMARLIDDMLMLARIGRAEVKRERVDLSALARKSSEDLAEQQPGRVVAVEVEPALVVYADAGLVRVLLDNLLGNAWKFTARVPDARIELKAQRVRGETIFSVRDNGAGFDMTHAQGLFKPFHRLHDAADYPGTGVGLATVQRVINRHGGRIWAEGAVGAGATVYFTIPDSRGKVGP